MQTILVNVYQSDDLKNRIKMAALLNEQTMQSWITEALWTRLHKEEKERIESGR